jgi:sensor histidine kinase YesM
MKRIIPHLVALFILNILLVFEFNSAFAEAQINTISSTDKSIRLKHWQIAKDPAPKDILRYPPDSTWRSFVQSLKNEQYSEGNWLIRTEILITDSANTGTVWGLFPIHFFTAYEIYWDGIKVAQNGLIGIDKADEKAGIFDFDISLPHHLVTMGKHSIILRLSNYTDDTSWKWYYGGLIIGPYDAELKNMFLSSYRAFFIMGILFIPFLFNLFLYIARKHKTEHLLFSLICFIVILDSIVSMLPLFVQVQTTYVHWQLYAYQIITFIFALLFPAFFIYMFSFPKKIVWSIIVIILSIALFFTNIWNYFSVMSFTVLIVSSIIAMWALMTRREGSIIILIGIIAAWVALFLDFAFAGLASIMVICTSISIARQFARKEKAEQEALFKSADLENQLLKKNINPHFLLNTLTSIIVWLRKDSKSAIKLIEALAEEFRMILNISALKQIPIRQEIDLCKAHLKIMSYRKGADYNIETVDIVEEESVPPMLFHTLIENGLTHGYENKMQGTFILQRKIISNGVQYILSNDGDFNNDESKDSSGFGLRYIKSRLEESYPDRWTLLSQREALGWKTVIEIKDM